ncbi:hypothetical protein CHS0354_038098 [Potamilus streckersoni]|uniref:Uncharacterized protein n=1 Tax=Potamilus streckersoni TaxID=2493646 RepID=A0AAE0SJG0_9BIVA|nr:hypothetical protein CHS0354_038098 [Potamilus streckersoni]
MFPGMRDSSNFSFPTLHLMLKTQSDKLLGVRPSLVYLSLLTQVLRNLRSGLNRVMAPGMPDSSLLAQVING